MLARLHSSSPPHANIVAVSLVSPWHRGPQGREPDRLPVQLDDMGCRIPIQDCRSVWSSFSRSEYLKSQCLLEATSTREDSASNIKHLQTFPIPISMQDSNTMINPWVPVISLEQALTQISRFTSAGPELPGKTEQKKTNHSKKDIPFGGFAMIWMACVQQRINANAWITPSELTHLLSLAIRMKISGLFLNCIAFDKFQENCGPNGQTGSSCTIITIDLIFRLLWDAVCLQGPCRPQRRQSCLRKVVLGVEQLQSSVI